MRTFLDLVGLVLCTVAFVLGSLAESRLLMVGAIIAAGVIVLASVAESIDAGADRLNAAGDE